MSVQSKIKMNDFCEMSATEMKKIVGGANITGVRFYNGTCYCDYQLTAESAPRCDVPCELINCENWGIDTGIGVL